MLQFTAVAVLLVAVPGPNVLFIVSRGIEHGTQAAYMSAIGIELGTLVHVVGAAAGVAALIASSPLAFQLLRYAGAGYLLLLAGAAWRAQPVPDRTPTHPTTDRSAARLLLDAALVNVLNPKVALFFVALLPQFLDPVLGPTSVQALVLGLVFFAVALTLDLAYAAGSSVIGGLLRRSRTAQWLRRYLCVATYLLLSVRTVLSGPPPR